MGISILYPCALEFFFSNEYRSGPKKRIWNVIDVFLKYDEALLSPAEKDYLKGMRDSYMSLYEVTHIEPEKSLTLKSLIKYDSQEIVVTEKRGTRQLAEKEIIGARIVQTKNKNFLAGGILCLSKKAAKEAKKTIESISGFMLSEEFLNRIRAEQPNPELMVRKMWVKEISGEWFRDHMNRQRPPTVMNIDGDPFEHITLTFPMTVPKKEMSALLNSLSELMQTGFSQWIWRVKNNPEIVTHPLNKEDGEEAGTLYSVYAEIRIKGKNLIASVNSQEHVSILKNFLKIHLAGKIGEPQ